MPALKFSTMVGKTTIFLPYKTESDFSHFVFQLSNSDTGDRKTYDLIIYAIFRTVTEPIPLNPNSIDWKATSDHPINTNVVMGNLTLDKDTLIKLFDQNPGVSYFGFQADKLGTGKESRYVQYTVYPCSASGMRLAKFGAFTAFLNPSPPR